MQKNNNEQTLYEILRVSPTATLEEIKIAYRRMAMEYHPDVNPGTNNKTCHEMMCKINGAYSVLRDVEARKLYDQTLRESGQYPHSSNVDESSKQNNNTSTKKENQSRTYTRESYNYDKMYEFYNSIDFDEYTQQDFINWIDNFSTRYIRLVFDYYKKLNINEMDMLERLYTDFNNIIDYEKNLSKKNSRRKSKSL